MNTRLARSWRLGVIVLLAAGLTAYVRRVPWTPVLAMMSHSSYGLLALALSLHWLAMSGKAGIWWIFLSPLGGPRFTTVARGTLLGATLNSLFVGSSGEAGRVLLMSRLTGIPSSSILATVVLERAVDLGGFLTLLASAALLFPVPRSVTLVLCAALCIGMMIAVVRRLGGPQATRRCGVSRDSRSQVARCLLYVRYVIASTRDIATKGRISIALVLTLVDWCSELASYSLVARAAGFPMGVRGSLLALLAVNVGFLVRVTPGNVGVFELVYATIARALGLPYDLALGVALMLHLVQDVPTALMGLSFGLPFFTREALPAAHARMMSSRIQAAITPPSTGVPHTEPARGTSS
jgi:uncharacterized protein (TIRG00374 family)